MRSEIKLEGTAELKRAINKLAADQRKGVKDAVMATGLELMGMIKRAYQKGPASGRIYHLSHPTRVHQASREGEAPMSDTGNLANQTVIDEVQGDDMAVEVVNRTAYGLALEFGTRDGRIKQRPAWRPAAKEIRPKFLKRIRAAIEKAMRDATR